MSSAWFPPPVLSGSGRSKGGREEISVETGLVLMAQSPRTIVSRELAADNLQIISE